MKKILLVLGSWAMMLMGTATFTSCGDDDDDDNGTSTVVNNAFDPTSQIALVESNKDITKAVIDGDNVIAKEPAESNMPNTFTIFNFQGDKLMHITTITVCKDEAEAKDFAEKLKMLSGDDIIIKDNYAIWPCDNEIEEDWSQDTKESICTFYNDPDNYNYY